MPGLWSSLELQESFDCVVQKRITKMTVRDVRENGNLIEVLMECICISKAQSLPHRCSSSLRPSFPSAKLGDLTQVNRGGLALGWTILTVAEGFI